jgi:hypothetical protein
MRDGSSAEGVCQAGASAGRPISHHHIPSAPQTWSPAVPCCYGGARASSWRPRRCMAYLQPGTWRYADGRRWQGRSGVTQRRPISS